MHNLPQPAHNDGLILTYLMHNLPTTCTQWRLILTYLMHNLPQPAHNDGLIHTSEGFAAASCISWEQFEQEICEIRTAIIFQNSASRGQDCWWTCRDSM